MNSRTKWQLLGLLQALGYCIRRGDRDRARTTALEVLVLLEQTAPDGASVVSAA
jgi:hypothetical protein